MLCYLEGLTHEQAAASSAGRVGTVKTRLARARDASAAGSAGSIELAWPRLPQGLLNSTTATALRDAARHGADGAGVVSSAVTTITEGILKMMWFDRLRFTVITLVALIAAAGLGASIVAQQVAEEGRAPVVAGSQVQLDDKPGSKQVVEVNATTDFDPATLTTVRTQFDGRVNKVFVDLGQAVKNGDPLLEIFSTDLASAKNDFETARMQHNRDLKTLRFKEQVAKRANLPGKEVIEAENEEKSRFAMNVAKDKLLIFGLSEEEIGKIAEEVGVQKANLVLRSRGDGIVIKRSVVQGNFYSAKDELMQIARLDRVWVRGRVSEKLVGKITLGQNLQVVAPFATEVFHGKLEVIDHQIDPQTQSLLIRTSIPNPDRRLRAGMFVRVLLEVPPSPTQAAEPLTSANTTPGSNIQQRLEILKPKLEILLKANADQTATATFEAHLGALEQELELLLREAAGK